ncbi:hypothetical protein QAD02_001902 [Eretmocerus hayati]|uniref:Uncharacterized protein n=1 Tax=Eretmocerus hayati TaxID=131215 RepID=A0ACC2NHI4_9HYME|nr:hypothetical protein QAD02_001902 [Eretmocerus hayati]
MHGYKDTIKIKTKRYWTLIPHESDDEKQEKRFLVVLSAGKSPDEIIKREGFSSSRRQNVIPPQKHLESATDEDDVTKNSKQNKPVSTSKLTKAFITNNVIVKPAQSPNRDGKKRELTKSKSLAGMYPEAMAVPKQLPTIKHSHVSISREKVPSLGLNAFDLQNMQLSEESQFVINFLSDIKASINRLETRLEGSEAALKEITSKELTKIKTQYDNIMNHLKNSNIAQGAQPVVSITKELPSRETENGKEYLLGRDVYIPANLYNAVEFDAKRRKTGYVRSLAQALFGKETLIASSVHGEKGPNVKRKNANDEEERDDEGREVQEARPRLDCTKLLAIGDAYVWWLQTRLSLTKEESESERANVDNIIARLIVDLWEPPQRKEAKRQCAKKHRDLKRKAGASIRVPKKKVKESYRSRASKAGRDSVSRDPSVSDSDSGGDEEAPAQTKSSQNKFNRIKPSVDSSDDDDKTEASQNSAMENFESYTEDVNLNELSDASDSTSGTKEQTDQ